MPVAPHFLMLSFVDHFRMARLFPTLPNLNGSPIFPGAHLCVQRCLFWLIGNEAPVSSDQVNDVVGEGQRYGLRQAYPDRNSRQEASYDKGVLNVEIE